MSENVVSVKEGFHNPDGVCELYKLINCFSFYVLIM